MIKLHRIISQEYFVDDREEPGSNMSTLLNSYWDIVKYLQFMSLDDKISMP